MHSQTSEIFETFKIQSFHLLDFLDFWDFLESIISQTGVNCYSADYWPLTPFLLSMLRRLSVFLHNITTPSFWFGVIFSLKKCISSRHCQCYCTLWYTIMEELKEINHTSLCKFHLAYNLMGSVHNILVWKYRRECIGTFRLLIIHRFSTKMFYSECYSIRYFRISFEQATFLFETAQFPGLIVFCSYHISLPFHKIVVYIICQFLNFSL